MSDPTAIVGEVPPETFLPERLTCPKFWPSEELIAKLKATIPDQRSQSLRVAAMKSTKPMPSRPALPSPEVRRLGEPPARGPDDARRGSYLREAA